MTEMLRHRLATGITCGAVRDTLATIALDGVAAALWQRARPEGFSDWLDALPAESLPAWGGYVVAVDAAATVRAACRDRVGADTPAAEAFAQDVGSLAAEVARITGQPVLDLRLDCGRGATESPFRMSRRRARLVCTYRGPGIEVGMARPDAEPDRRLVIDPGSVVLFRGAFWPGPQFPGLMHRAPAYDPVADIGFRLSIEPVDSTAGRC